MLSPARTARDALAFCCPSPSSGKDQPMHSARLFRNRVLRLSFSAYDDSTLPRRRLPEGPPGKDPAPTPRDGQKASPVGFGRRIFDTPHIGDFFAPPDMFPQVRRFKEKVGHESERMTTATVRIRGNLAVAQPTSSRPDSPARPAALYPQNHESGCRCPALPHAPDRPPA